MYYSRLSEITKNEMSDYTPKIINIHDKPLSYKTEVFTNYNKYNVDRLFTKDEEYNFNPELTNTTISYNNDYYKNDINYTEEKLIKKNLGDIEIIEWLKTQSDPKLAVFAEMLNAPVLHQNIEIMRPTVDKIKNINIETYIKKKRLGTKYASFLYDLKDKYGDNILKFLYLTVI
jgi:hypothetical protein